MFLNHLADLKAEEVISSINNLDIRKLLLGDWRFVEHAEFEADSPRSRRETTTLSLVDPVMESNHEHELSQWKTDGVEAVRCARCNHFNEPCKEVCLFAPGFPETERENFLLVLDVYGAVQVENILLECEPNLRKIAAATLVVEAQARKRDPVRGVAGIVEDLNRRVFLLKMDLLLAYVNLENA